VHNQGNIDLIIEKILFENGRCSFLGFSIANCEISLLLKPLEMYSLQITYSPSVFLYTEPLFLSIFSSTGVKVFQIEQKLPENSGIELFLSNSEELLVISTSLLIALLALQIKTLKVKKTAKRSYSSNDLIPTNCPQVFIKDFTAPVFSQFDEKITPRVNQDKNESLEKDRSDSLNSSESAKSSETLENSQPFKYPKRPKPSKITKLKNVVKSEGKLKKIEQKLPEVIANNKLLLAANIKRIFSEEPAPHPEEPESDEDCYLDSYKTRNILFGLASPSRK
jgi:hypothetical protein